jgi:hypothetical protein
MGAGIISRNWQTPRLGDLGSSPKKNHTDAQEEGALGAIDEYSSYFENQSPVKNNKPPSAHHKLPPVLVAFHNPGSLYFALFSHLLAFAVSLLPYLLYEMR